VRGDVSGIAAPGAGFIASDGTGGLIAIDDDAARPLAIDARAWDDHLIALPCLPVG